MDYIKNFLLKKIRLNENFLLSIFSKFFDQNHFKFVIFTKNYFYDLSNVNFIKNHPDQS